MRIEEAKGDALRQLAASHGFVPETDEQLRARLARHLGRVCRLGTTADFACIADEALRREAPIALDLMTSRRFVVYAWARELGTGSLWRRFLAWLVTRAFFRLARGR